MLDDLDRSLLNALQCDDSRTAEELSEEVPLSPSAIARRLRRLRRQGWILRSIALLSPRLRDQRLRALVFVQLSEHADLDGKAALEARLLRSSHVQFCYEVAGQHDFVALFDCLNMAEFNVAASELLASTDVVRRYETYFVKREVKFAPFVDLREPNQ